MNEQNNQTQPREKKKLKLGASAFNITETVNLDNSSQILLASEKSNSVSKEKEESNIKQSQNDKKLQKKGRPNYNLI